MVGGSWEPRFPKHCRSGEMADAPGYFLAKARNLTDKTKNISICDGAVVELADTPALGAGAARYESSSLSRATTCRDYQKRKL